MMGAALCSAALLRAHNETEARVSTAAGRGVAKRSPNTAVNSGFSRLISGLAGAHGRCFAAPANDKAPCPDHDSFHSCTTPTTRGKKRTYILRVEIPPRTVGPHISVQSGAPQHTITGDHS